jgi:hypothetical protein
MNIYIFNANGQEGNGVSHDAWMDEPLTVEEITSIEAVLPEMKKIIGQIDFVFAGAKTRSGHSALIVATFYKCVGFMDCNESFNVPGKEKLALKSINNLIGKENIFIDGHNPYIWPLISMMTKPGEIENEILLKNKELALVHYNGFIVPHEGDLKWIRNLSV